VELKFYIEVQKEGMGEDMGVEEEFVLVLFLY